MSAAKFPKRCVMRKSILGAVATIFLGTASLAGATGAQAASIDLGLSFGGPDYYEPTQFYMWNDRRYCWYDDGWHGPGYYWCGYHWRRGYGWGGPMGWHGWRHPHYRSAYRGGGWHNRHYRSSYRGHRDGGHYRGGDHHRGGEHHRGGGRHGGDHHGGGRHH